MRTGGHFNGSRGDRDGVTSFVRSIFRPVYGSPAAAASVHAALVVYFFVALQSRMRRVARKVVRPAVARPP
jgi:hypothetical protein